jgi:hypothetical protein
VAVPAARVWSPPEHVIVVDPVLKVTAPAGVPDPGDAAATVAVYVTCWPTTGVLVEALRVVVVDALATVTLAVPDEPPYVSLPL